MVPVAAKGTAHTQGSAGVEAGRVAGYEESGNKRDVCNTFCVVSISRSRCRLVDGTGLRNQSITSDDVIANEWRIH